MSKTLRRWTMRGLAGLRAIGPYALIEILLPGGSIVAALLWLYRHHHGMERRA